MKNALAEWQHKEMLSASNTGGYFAVFHPNDTVRQGGHGSAGFVTVRHGLVRSGRARRSWYGEARQGLVRLGGARLGPVRSVQARRSGSGVARPGVMRSGVATKAKTKVGGRADPSPSNKRKEEKWKKE